MKTKSQPGSPKPLPFMATFEDAERLYQTEKDPFYLAAFLCQLWLDSIIHLRIHRRWHESEILTLIFCHSRSFR